VTRRAAATGAAALIGVGILAGCASGPTRAAAPSGPACPDFTPPQRLGVANPAVPDSFLAARIGGEVVDEVVIGSDGAVRAVRSVRSRFPELAPYAQAYLQKTRFTPASIQGNKVASRVVISTLMGVVRPARREPTFDTVWAFVPGGQSREAQWQLRDSVSTLTLVVRVENPMPGGGEIVAKAPDGSERALWKLAAVATPPADVRETVDSGKFFRGTGDYRIELRSGGRTIAFTTLTIADSYETAIVNACERVGK
jgi:hypothetical protein